MQYIQHYDSPLGKILLAADERGLTGAWFADGKRSVRLLDQESEEKSTETLEAAKRWLDVYFSGRDPGRFAPLHMIGTEFQKSVWNILLEIPYGKVTTYGRIARRIEEEKGLGRMSARAVGKAVGRNEIAIIVPCHRVVGESGSLTGYAGGIDRKEALLRREHAWKDGMYNPAKKAVR